MYSFPWNHNHGQLTLVERSRILIRAMMMTRRRSKRSSLAPKIDGISLDVHALDHIKMPEDAVSISSWQLAQRVQPPWLMNHVLRTFLWAELLAMQSGIQSNRVVLFSSCVLHDLGLTTHAAQPSEHCFAVRGARAAQGHIEALGEITTARRVAAAISQHVDLEVGMDRGVEAHLLHAGASVDVTGRRARELPVAVRDAVLTRHPRHNIKKSAVPVSATRGHSSTQNQNGFVCISPSVFGSD